MLKGHSWFEDDAEIPSVTELEKYKPVRDLKNFMSKNYESYIKEFAKLVWQDYINDKDKNEDHINPKVEEIGSKICKGIRNSVTKPMLSDIENNIWDEFVPAVARTGIYTGVIGKKHMGKIISRIEDVVEFLNDSFMVSFMMSGTSELKSQNEDFHKALKQQSFDLKYCGKQESSNMLITTEEVKKLKEFVAKKFE
jgi:hypothetical protein